MNGISSFPFVCLQQSCRDGLSKAQQAVNAASSDTAKAEAQIEVEVHEALLKAVEWSTLLASSPV